MSVLLNGLVSIAAPVHLLLTVEPSQTTYIGGKSLTFKVNVFNQLNPVLQSTLTLTITGPNNYYHFDFQSVNVAADAVQGHSFNWVVPDAVGTYVVEASLVPPQLTAYDTVWLKVG